MMNKMKLLKILYLVTSLMLVVLLAAFVASCDESQTMQVIQDRLSGVNTILMAISAILLAVLFVQNRMISQIIHKKTSEKDPKVTNVKKKDEPDPQLNVNTLEARHMQMHIQIQRLIEEEKIYNRKNLTQPYLADIMKTNVHYLSTFFAQYYKTTYSDYFNELRVREACKLILDDEQRKLSIDQVSDMVGFASRSTFYPVFKKFTGITPAVFQKDKDVNALNIKL